MRIDGDHLIRFCHNVHTRLMTIGCIAVCTIPVGLLLYFLFPANLLLRALGVQCIGLGLAFGWYIFRHRSDLLHLVRRPQGATLEDVTVYFFKRKLIWENWYPYLLMIGLLIALGFFYAILFSEDRLFGQITGALMVSYLLGMIGKNTMDFLDQLLLQDLRHDLHDHSS